MPQDFPLQIYRGDTSSWQFVLWQDANMTIGFDLLGYTVKAEIRDRPSNLRIWPLVITSVTGNNIYATLPAASSAQLPASCVWDLQLTDAAGVITTILSGRVYVTADVTDSLPLYPSARITL